MDDDLLCPNCGLERDRWSDNNGYGYTLDGDTFCCRGCAEDSGCICTPVEEDAPADRWSARSRLRYLELDADEE